MMKTLNTLPIGTAGKIQEVNVTPSLKRRLFDLGFIPGSLITPIYPSVLGDPIAYSIRGITIALRNQDAQEIFLE